MPRSSPRWKNWREPVGPVLLFYRNSAVYSEIGLRSAPNNRNSLKRLVGAIGLESLAGRPEGER